MRTLRRADPPIPPDRLRFMGDEPDAFRRIGDRLVGDLRTFAGLRSRSKVLDVGSGYGRIAHALLRDRKFRGHYIGMDILERHVTWCADNLGSRRVEFHHLDVRNDRYNPKGSVAATQIELPIEPATVDVALAASVFTHMWPQEIAHYLQQIATALRPGGHAYLTFFLLDETWRRLHADGPQGTVVMHHRHDDHVRYMNPQDPLHAIGYSPEWVTREAASVGLRQTGLQLGAWCGRPDGRGFQDALIVTR